MAGFQNENLSAVTLRNTKRRRYLTAVTLLVLCAVSIIARGADLGVLDADRVSRAKITVPMVFPVLNGSFSGDSFLADRDGGKRRHHGQDLFGRKMQPLVAVFDGLVYFGKSQGTSGNTLTIFGDNGWIANYRHINNDNPKTNDGQGSDKYAFSSQMRCGGRVKAGQFVAYLGNSGNAEGTSPHLHFELVDRETGGIINPAPSLRSAKRIKKLVPADKETPGEVGPGDMRVANGSLVLLKGEILLIGTIRSVNMNEGEVVMVVSCVSTREGHLVGLHPKREKIIRYYGNTVIRDIDDGGIGFGIEDLRASQAITVVGRDFGTGSVLPARVIAIDRVFAGNP